MNGQFKSKKGGNDEDATKEVPQLAKISIGNNLMGKLMKDINVKIEVEGKQKRELKPA